MAVGSGTVGSGTVGSGIVGSGVSVAVGVSVCVAVGVGVSVAVGVSVYVAVGVGVYVRVGHAHHVLVGLGVGDGVLEGTCGGVTDIMARVCGRIMTKVHSSLSGYSSSPGDSPSPLTTTTCHRYFPGRSIAEVTRSLRSRVQK